MDFNEDEDDAQRNLKKLKVEGKKRNKNLADLTRQLVDLADILDGVTNSSSNSSVISKRKKRRKRKTSKIRKETHSFFVRDK